MIRTLAALALALVVPFASAAWEPGSDGLVPVPALSERVEDLTGTLTASEIQALVAKLAAWEQKSGNQLAVLIVPTTQPESIEAYSIRVADAWKIGRKGKDNGAILLVAKNDRKLRIEVGYGLEGVLTDLTSRRIIAETIAPLFRENKFAQGIDAGVDQIIAVVDKGQPLAAPPASTAPKGQGLWPARGFSFETLIILVFVVVPILGAVLRRIFGSMLGATVGAGIVGAGAWVVAGSLIVAIIAAIVALVILLFTGGGGSGLARSGGGMWIPTGGGGWGGGGGGGGGFSGGGGGFGGGGASGNW